MLKLFAVLCADLLELVGIACFVGAVLIWLV